MIQQGLMTQVFLERRSNGSLSGRRSRFIKTRLITPVPKELPTPRLVSGSSLILKILAA
jgi:hypothetical protein